MAWSAAVLVGQDLSAFDLVGLLGVVRRHDDAASDEAMLQEIVDSLVAMKGAVEGFGDALAGEVVFGGTEATGDQDDVGAVDGDLDGGAKVIAVVADDGLERYGDAEVVEARGEVERVGVLTMRREHLGTDGDDLCKHVWYLMVARAGVNPCDELHGLGRQGVFARR